MIDKNLENSEIFAETKKNIDNLLIDPRKIERTVLFNNEKHDDSIIGDIKEFAEKYSNGRIKISPTFNLTNQLSKENRVIGIKIKFEF